jgi:hypothetical protein
VADKVIGFTLKVDGVDKTVKSIDDLDNAISQLEDTLKNAEFGSKQFKEIEQDLVKARSAKEDLDKSLEGRGAEKRLQGLVGMAESLGGAFAIASQASALFGSTNTAVAEAEAKAQQALAVVMGVRAIKEGLLNSALERKIVLEKASAIGTAALNAVNKAFNITLSMNPIGLVVTALGLLVIGVMAAIGPIKKLIGSFDFLNDAAEATMNTLRDVGSFLTGGLIDDAATSKTRSNADKVIEAFDDVNSAGNQQIAGSKRRLALMQAQGASEAQLLAQKKKINAEEVASRQAAITQLLKLQAMDGELDDEKKKKLAELQTAIKDLNNQAQIDQAAYNKKVADDQKAANEKAAEKQKEKRDKYNEHAKEMLDAAREADKKTAELRQKAEIDAIKDEELKAQKTLQIQQENANKELQIEIDKFANKKNLTKEEQKYLASLYAEQKQMVATQAGETQTLLDDQAKVRKEKDEAFAKELKDIKDQAFLMSIEDQKVKARTELQLQLDSQIAEINASELTEKQKGEKIAAVRSVNDAQKKEQEAAFKQKDMEDAMSFNQWQIDQDTTSFEEKLALVGANEEILKNMTFETENQKTAALKQNADTRKAIEIAELEAKVAIASAGMDVAAQAGQFLQQIAGENKAVAIAGIVVEQAAAIGKIVANTAVANAKSVAAFPLTAGMPWVAINTVSAGLSIASTIASAAKSISAIKGAGGGESGGGGGSSTPPTPAASKFATGGLVTGAGTGTSDSIPAMLSNGESVINAQSTSMFGGLLNQINQAGGGAPIPVGNSNSNAPAPIFKTYVVASDMSSQQEADKRIKDIAKI